MLDRCPRRRATMLSFLLEARTDTRTPIRGKSYGPPVENATLRSKVDSERRAFHRKPGSEARPRRDVVADPAVAPESYHAVPAEARTSQAARLCRYHSPPHTATERAIANSLRLLRWPRPAEWPGHTDHVRSRRHMR